MPSIFEENWNILIQQSLHVSPANLLPIMRSLLEQILKDFYKKNALDYPKNIASAITDFGYRKQIDYQTSRALHRLRRNANFVLHEGYSGTISDLQNGLFAIRQTLYYSHGIKLSEEPDLKISARLQNAYAQAKTDGSNNPAQSTIDQTNATDRHDRAQHTTQDKTLREHYKRATIIDIDEPKQQLHLSLGDDEEQQDDRSTIKLATGANFAHLLDQRLLYNQVNLIGLRTDEQNGTCSAEFIVLEPDYLINVTQIAECFQNAATLPALSFINALRSEQSTAAMFFGNLVNHVLDKEVAAAAHGSQFDLDDFIRNELFRYDPLGWSATPDFQQNQNIHEVISKLKQHYHSIRHSRELGFVSQASNYTSRQKVDIAKASLEPAFISAKYGLQGRIDLLHIDQNSYDLVELKSSKSYPSYAGKVWKNHQAQALLYRLLLEDVAASHNINSGQTGILYSAATRQQSPLRHVQSDPQLMEELIATRNRIVMLEQQLANAADSEALAGQLEEIFNAALQSPVPFYVHELAAEQRQLWLGSQDTPKHWALEYLRFSAKELEISMLGNSDSMHNQHGMSAIWLSSTAAKKQAGSILDELRLNDLNQLQDSRIRLAFGSNINRQDHAAVNFREGDTLLLYPQHRKNSALERRLGALESQGLKVTLEKIDSEGVLLNLMGKLVSKDFFENHDLWALEPANYDTFRKEWAYIAGILALEEQKRQKLLGQRLPQAPPQIAASTSTSTQLDVVARAVASPDYFLLCGPPGTGKTSTALRHMVEQLHAQNKTILLAAYTRRAVDEICKMLEEVAKNQTAEPANNNQPFNYIRLTSELHTEEYYHERLLDKQMTRCHNRQQVRSLIDNCRIFVGTVSGLLQKQHIFQFKNFDVAIIDEASQILEIPTLALVSKVAKFILIGDHKQLPAVVQQEPEQSKVSASARPHLSSIGLENLRGSYFERMFRLCKQHAPWACGTLQVQYRMHDDIMALVNQRFYANQLTSGTPRQKSRLAPHSHWHHSERPLHQILRKSRVIFHPIRTPADSNNPKQNAEEARLASEYALEIALGMGAEFNPANSLGIIASYRSQVALIRKMLEQIAEEQNIPALAQVTVDTVERYQGSQRDIIILSFSVNYWWQMQQITNTSIDEDNGQLIDRKLNVALTRSREQLILIGNPEILKHAETHANLIADITAQGGLITEE